MGCAVTKKAKCTRQQQEEERKLNTYWYDREEHLITVHEPSSIADPSDLRKDMLHTLTKEQEMILRGISSDSPRSPGGSPCHKMPKKAAKVLLDPECIRRDSGIDVESCGDDEDEAEEVTERHQMLPASLSGSSESQLCLEDITLHPKSSKRRR